MPNLDMMFMCLLERMSHKLIDRMGDTLLPLWDYCHRKLDCRHIMRFRFHFVRFRSGEDIPCPFSEGERRETFRAEWYKQIC